MIHQCPPVGGMVTPCCHQLIFDLPLTDRLSIDSTEVTCSQLEDAHQHVWVALVKYPIIVTSIEPAEGGEGDWANYVVPLDAYRASLEEAVFGCDLCDEPLSRETFGTECKGVPDDLEALFRT